MNKTSLKPCPCCGGVADIQQMRDVRGFFFRVRCENGCLRTASFRTKDEAVKMWNTRVKPQMEPHKANEVTE